MKVLIVDDEPSTRDGLRDIVGWPAIGIGGVMTANDGLDALEKVERFMPDIMLCDVRMPRMNGVELVGKLREDARFRNLQVIFLSGYSDKEYLKAAIRYQAFDYVEKPVDIGRLEEVVSHAVEKIRSADTHNDGWLLAELERGNPAAVQALEGMRGGKYGYRALLIGVLQLAEGVEADRRKWLESGLRRRFPASLLAQQQPRCWLSLLADRPEELTDQAIGEWADGLLRESGAVSVAVAAGKRVGRAEDVPGSIREARSLGEQFFFYGYGNVYLKASARRCDPPTFQALYSRLTDALKNRQYDDLPGLLERMKPDVRGMGVTPQKARLFALEMLLEIRHSLFAWQNEAFPVMPEERLHEILDELPTLDDVFRYAAESADGMLNTVRRHLDGKDLAFRIRCYVEDNFSKPLTLENLADCFCYSPNYLSAVFVKKNNMGISQYLTRVRIEKAKRILGEPGASPGEAARQVGFQDYAHFSRVFKKLEGMSPRAWMAGKRT